MLTCRKEQYKYYVDVKNLKMKLIKLIYNDTLPTQVITTNVTN